MEHDKQQNLVNFNQSASLTLIAVFSVNRTVQLWSRSLGSTGGWFYGWMFFVGLAIQAWYYEANAQFSGSDDFVSCETMAGMSVIWFAIHGVTRSFQCAGGLPSPSYEPGVGILYWMFPAWSDAAVALASDLAVAIFLSISLRWIGSPILSGWYASMCFWLLVGHLSGLASYARTRQAAVDAQDEAERYSNQIRERR